MSQLQNERFAVKGGLRHRETRRNGWVWVGRGNSGRNARHCYVAPAAADDATLTRPQLRLLLIIGRFHGWVELDQGDLAKQLGLKRGAVNRALRGLVKAGHIDQRTQKQAGEARCQYRVAASAAAEPAESTPECADDAHLCTPQAHRGVLPRNTPPAPVVDSSRARLDQSDHPRSKKEEAFFIEDSGTDGDGGTATAEQQPTEPAEGAAGSAAVASGERLPFTSEVLREIASLGVDVIALIERFRTRTRGRPVYDPSAYLLQMGRDEAAKTHGTTPEAIKAMATRNRSDRAVAMAAAVGVSAEPSERYMAGFARRIARYGVDPRQLAVEWRETVSYRRFATSGQAERSLDSYVASLINGGRRG